MKYSVCIDCVCMRQNPLEAMELVKRCGYSAVEFWGWETKDIQAMAMQAARLQLDIAAFCTTSVNIGNRALHDEYIKGLERTAEVARQLHCRTLITTIGQSLPDVSHESHHKAAVDALRRAAVIAEREGLMLVVEPLNPRDHPGYPMSTSQEAFQMVEEVGSSNVKVLFDIYHQQVSEGDLLNHIIPNIDLIGHFHMAGNPGRCVITEGEIQYAEILKTISETGYAGYLGLEYLTDDCEKSLRQSMTLLQRY